MIDYYEDCILLPDYILRIHWCLPTLLEGFAQPEAVDKRSIPRADVFQIDLIIHQTEHCLCSG